MHGCSKTTCPYCGVGCGVEAKPDGLVGDKEHPANHGALCVKGAALAESLNMPSRLLYPKLADEQVSWEQASDWIAQRIHQAMEQYGPESVAMYVSGQLLTEDYYVANKLMKGYVGSANIDTNSRLCMSSAVAAHVRAFGEDVVPVSYDDLEHAELIVISGANTAWTHPVLFRRIQQIRDRNPNVKLVVIDPRKTVTAEQADLHLPIANDSDVSLFNGLLAYLIEQQGSDTGVDTEFIEQHTQGFAALQALISSGAYQLEQVAFHCGIDVQALRTFYQWFSRSNATMTLFCQGVNQAQNGVDKANAIINAHLATGQIGKRGAGPFSLTGQPNAMGGREVGGLANQLAAHRGFDPDSIRAVQRVWQSPRIAEQPGLKALDLFKAVERGEIKVLWIMATNPVVSMPDNRWIRQALERCPCVIVSDITADSDVAHYADLLLPAAGWGEKQGMVTNSERRMSRQRRFISPPGEAKPDWQAICEVGARLSQKLQVKNGFAFESEAAIFREFARLTAINSDSHYKLDLSQYQNLSDEAYEQWRPTQWGGESPYADRRFSHPDGKARFVAATELANSSDEPIGRGLWRLNSGRQRDQWHTMTRTGHIEKLAASELEPSVYLNSLSAERLELQAGELANITNPDTLQSLLAKVVIDESMAFGELFMSMHWAGRYGGQSQVNAVVSAMGDPISGQPAFKSGFVKVEKAPVASFGVMISKFSHAIATDYCAYQHQEQSGVWRIASLTLPPQQLAERNLLAASKVRRVSWQHELGWITLQLQSHTHEVSQAKLQAIFIASSQPLKADYQQLQKLIGEPINWQALMQAGFATRVSQLVCSCLRVTDTQIEQAIEQKGVTTLTQLQNQLQCGTNCGSCIPQLKQYFAPAIAQPSR
ncbi:nitrate reductase [Vibrio vulnificus]|nr:nitrate reductase [Vibrio vulnificus]